MRQIDEWVQGRSWLVRLPLLIFFAWVLLGHLRDPLYASIFDGLNLALHEIGHILFAPLGPFMGVAGGTIFQLLCPVIAAVLFYRQRDFFAIAVCFCWLSTNFFNVAVYAGDARMNALPLVSPFGGAPAHDWTTMLSQLDMLDRDRELARLFRRLGTASMLAGLASGGWLLWKMRQAGRSA